MVGLIITMIGLSCPIANALDPERMLSQYSQKSWSRDDGLPQNSVRALAQTSDGYLWIGTDQGLVRFDGVRFVPFELRLHDGRVDGFVETLYPEPDTLWVGTVNGLHRFTGDRFVEVLTRDGSSAASVKSIFRDSDSRVWIGTAGGLFREQDGCVVPFGDVEGSGPEDMVTAIVESPAAGLCFSAGGVFCLDGGVLRELTAVSDAAGNSRCEDLGIDSTGALWVATTGKGLLRFDGAEIRRWGMADGMPGGLVSTLAIDSDDNVWFGGGLFGISRIGRRGVEVLSGRETMQVISILEDREGNLWLGTVDDGLIRLSSTLFAVYSIEEGLEDPSVRVVLEDHDGVIWIGTAGGGLHRLIDGRISLVGADEGLPSKDILALTEDSLGRLWVGTADGGVFVRDGGRFVPVPGGEDVALSLHEDPEGRMWAGRLGGVVRLERGAFRAVEPLQWVNAVSIEDGADGEVLFADGHGGVVVWRDGQTRRLGEDQGFPGNITLALLNDSDGHLWVGTHLAGLIFVEDDAPYSVLTDDGLCDNSVFAILEGPAGRLWMSSNIGVFAVDKDQLKAVARGRVSRADCRLFGTADGMRSAECNGGQSPSAWKDREGRLWFATVDGVVRIDPRNLGKSDPPPAAIEEITSSGVAMPIPGNDVELVLDSDTRELAIRYTAMTLTDPEQVRFRYRLEGFDEDWVEVGERRVAYFTNLPPRRFRFEVQTRVPGGFWAESGATIDFSLRPRFFEMRWFQALMVLAAASLILLAHRARVAVLRRRQRRLEGLVAERTRELAKVNETLEQRVEQGVAALRESDRMAAYGHLVAGVAHEVRHPVFAIRAAVHLVKQKLDGADDAREELDILGSETERIGRLVDDLLELGRPRELEPTPCRPAELIAEAVTSLTGHPEATLEILQRADDGLPLVLADRPAVVQVLVNLMINACRHAVGASRVTVGASEGSADEIVELTVTDDGAGISVTDQAKIFEPFFSGTGGTGLGLAIATRLARAHGGRLTVDSTVGEGATFILTLKKAPGIVTT